QRNGAGMNHVSGWLTRAAVIAAVGLQAFVSSAALAQGSTPAVQAPVEIKADRAKIVGPYKPIYSWFGYDEANYTTMKHGTQLLKELHDLSPVPVYIRAHHLLTSGDGV